MTIVSGTADPFSMAFAALKEAPSVDRYLLKCDTEGPSTLPPVHLIFPKFREDAPDIQALAEWLCFCAVNYAIPLKKRMRASADAATSSTGGDMVFAARLVNEAKRAFMEFNKKYPNRASEVGELLAYVVALHYLNAPQIASKMALKTSNNMPIHGLDGIHAKFSDGVMTLYFLESKLALTSKGGIRKYAESAASFAANRKQYLIEYEVLSDLGNLSALSEENRKIALEYLDVYGAKKDFRVERSIGVICYSEKRLYSRKEKKGDEVPPAAHEKAFAERLRGSAEEFSSAAKSALKKKGTDPSDCQLFFVALPDVRVLRSTFQEGMK